jgi:DNA-binding NtrC family response regulator
VGKKILAVDDESMILEAVKLILEDMGHVVHTYSDSANGEAAALAEDFDLILLDLRMPNKNGAQLTESIMKAKPGAKILLITAYPTDPLAAQALRAGAKSLLKKPFEIAKIVDFLGE